MVMDITSLGKKESIPSPSSSVAQIVVFPHADAKLGIEQTDSFQGRSSASQAEAYKHIDLAIGNLAAGKVVCIPIEVFERRVARLQCLTIAGIACPGSG